MDSMIDLAKEKVRKMKKTGLLLAALALAHGGAHAAGYPEQTITVVVPFAAGGGASLPRASARCRAKAW
jgi:hypothetical protein